MSNYTFKNKHTGQHTVTSSEAFGLGNEDWDLVSEETPEAPEADEAETQPTGGKKAAAKKVAAKKVAKKKGK